MDDIALIRPKSRISVRTSGRTSPQNSQLINTSWESLPDIAGRTSPQNSPQFIANQPVQKSPPGIAALAILTLLLILPAAAKLPQQILFVENHSDVLVPWIETGVRGAAIINIDAHDDCIPIAADHLQKLKILFTKEDIAAIRRCNGVTDSSLYDISNFITAAHALGVAREAIWAVPLPGSLSKKFPHLPFRTCLIDSLSSVKVADPVFVTVDADCVDPYANYRCINLVEAVRQIASAVRALPFDVKHLSIAFSHEGGYLPITLRWVGFALKDALEGKDLTQPKAPWTMLVTVEDWRRSLMPAENVRRIRPLLATHPKNPWLLVYMADALFRADSISAAFTEGKKAILLDSGCAPVLAEIGGELAIMKRYDDAERFLAAAPNIINTAAELAVAQGLDETGKTAQAIKHYARIGKQVANYSADLLMGYGYERLGDTAMAQKSYLRAVGLLKKPVSEMAGFADLTLAVTAAEQFLRKHGDAKSADFLRRDHRLSMYFRKIDK